VRESISDVGSTPVERIYFAWNDALSRNDAQALLALYAPDAHVESPLVPHLRGIETGVFRGHKELSPFFEMLAKRKPPVRQDYRTGYFTDGKRLIRESPREAGKGEQMDFVEAMEINDKGLIHRHCVYWGWLGVRVLQRNEHHRRNHKKSNPSEAKRVPNKDDPAISSPYHASTSQPFTGTKPLYKTGISQGAFEVMSDTCTF
jgi:ketosteroid isomerase-like protein